MKTIYDGDTVEHEGREYKVTYEPDCDRGAPWEEDDGCGIVSEWTTRDKMPGERVLHSDGRSRLLYDWQGTMQKARKEGWGLSDEAIAALARKLGRAPTIGEVTAKSVQSDFDYLRRYCNGDWQYVVICVEDVATGECDYLGGCEDSDMDYLSETTWDMIRGMARATMRQEQGKFSAVMEMGV